MIRRMFLTKDLPAYIEQFDNITIMVYGIDDKTSVEYVRGKYYLIECNENGITVIKKDYDDIKKYNRKSSVSKVRYFITIIGGFIAQVDVCNTPLISVDFNTEEEANNFEVPAWFGEELVPEEALKKKLNLKES